MTVTPPPPEVQIERTRVRVGRWTAVLVLGVTLAVVSIVLYATAGFTAATSISWLSSLAALALYFEHRSARIPRIALADFMVPLAVATVLSPLYLVKVYDWPV